MDFRKYDNIIGGAEQVVINISKNIAVKGHTIIMLCKKNNLPGVKKIFKDTPNIKYFPLNVKTHSISLYNAILDSTVIQNIAQKEDADLIHFPYNWSFPLRKKRPCILTIHDVIPFTFREAMGLFRNLFLYKTSIRIASRFNDIIVTVSEFSKKDTVERVGVSEKKIKVIPNGLQEHSSRNFPLERKLINKFSLKKGFILNVGGLHERKNIIRLIQAFSILVTKWKYPGKLVITGNYSGTSYIKKMKNLCDRVVTKTKMSGRVVFTGFIPDDQLDSLMRRTDLFVYPSLYEGFAIPILEAMNFGKPVITSNITAMPEVARDAAILVDPYNIEEISTKMSEVLNNKEEQDELIKKGKIRARSFSWKRTAKEYLDLYKTF